MELRSRERWSCWLRRSAPLLLLIGRVAVAQSPVAVTAGFDASGWRSPLDAVEFEITGLPDSAWRDVAIFIGPTDYTQVFVRDQRKLSYRPRGLRLAPGEQELKVYLKRKADAGVEEWTDVGGFTMRILTAGGYEKVEVNPRITLNNKGQLLEGHAPEREAGARTEYQDFTLNTGLQTLHLKPSWTLRTQANVLGASNRQEALRFGDRQDKAPKFDLADFTVTLERSAGSVSAGHLAFGQNRHLASGFGSRGLGATASLGRAAKFTAAALNGTSIVGWSNPLGVTQPDHRVLGGTLSLELVPSRPGLLQVEGTVVDGSLLPRAGYTQGVVNDAEESEGTGVRVLASDAAQRLRVEVGLSRSKSDHPDDPTLLPNVPPVRLVRVSRNARYLDASWQMLQNRPIGGASTSLAFAVRHERVDPLFRSVASATRADVQDDALEARATVGPVAVQLAMTRSHDNLARVGSILTTRTHMRTVNAMVPFGTMLGGSVWMPSVTYSRAGVHQFGDGVPPNSEFTPSHVPNQLSTTDAVMLQWQSARWRADYRLNLSDQDNRQVGREGADFLNTTHNVTLGMTPVPAVNLLLDIGFEGAESKEVGQENRTQRLGGTLDWRLTTSTSLAAAFTRTALEDDPFTSSQTATDLRIELSQRLPLVRLSPRTSAGQLFIRYARQRGATAGPTFARSATEAWTVSTGLTLSVL